MPHKIQFIINGNALTMKIDESSPQRVENIGFRKNFVVEEKSGLYLGGIPPEVTKSVISKFHVRSTESFKGNFFHITGLLKQASLMDLF